VHESETIVRQVRAVLEREPRINLHRYPIEVTMSDGDLIVEGEVEHIIAKKLALERAAAVVGIKGIVDRLRVAPAKHMEDGEIRDHVRDALLQELALENCSIRIWDKGELRTIHDSSATSSATIDVEMTGGVVTFNGQVPSLTHKRLAGVLAWWVPGSRDVINGLEVVPVQDDTDDEITDAVRIVHQKNPFVDASQIAINTRNAVVTLEGLVRNQTEKRLAEYDAWYVFGVDGVINQLTVRE
jgi:osmotically-inducible protein OsmY